MSQNTSKHTSEGLAIIKSYIKYTYILIIFCITGPILFNMLFPVLPILLIIIIIYTIILKCKMIYRAYEFYNLNSNPNSLYSPTGVVIADFIPILDIIRIPKAITEMLTNKPYRALNAEGAKYLYILIASLILSVTNLVLDSYIYFNVYLLTSLISVILAFYVLYTEVTIFKNIYNIQNDQALELEKNNIS